MQRQRNVRRCQTEHWFYGLYVVVVLSMFAFFVYVALHIHAVNVGVHLRRLLLVVNSTDPCPTSTSTYTLEPSTLLVIPTDREIMGTLLVLLCDGNTTWLSEMLKGAHVVVKEEDETDIYDWLRHLPGSYPRWSSHQSIVAQMGVPVFQGLHSIVTGVNRQNSTWFQFEDGRWKVGDVKSVLHLLNFMYYQLFGYQVGPFGISPHTDTRPIRLSLQHFHRQ